MARMNGKPALHTAQFVMRFTEADRTYLEALADAKQTTAAEVVRQLIRTAHEKLEAKNAKR